jgi:two-component system, OmpR family, response regulator
MHVLVVDSDAMAAAAMRTELRNQSMAADVAVKGEDAMWMAAETEYDAIVIDARLADADGLELCRRLRAEGVGAAVLIVTARNAMEERVAGLNAGADDCLSQPYPFVELTARLRALARRGPVRSLALEVGDLRLDPANRLAYRAETEIPLSARELALLETFMRHAGRVLGRGQLLDRAWDGRSERGSNVVDVYVNSLREKLDRPFGVESIETVRGAGYRLRADGGRAR